MIYRFFKCIGAGFSFAVLLLGSACNNPTSQTTELVEETKSSEKIYPLTQGDGIPFVTPKEKVENPISQFVRRIHRDVQGHLWMGTNGDGVVRYDGDTLGYFSIHNGFGGVAVRGIVEDDEGILWFGTERGLTKYDGTIFTNYSSKDGLTVNDTWSICLDSEGLLWIGGLQGVNTFDGKTFTSFELPAGEPDLLRGVTSKHIVHSIMQDSQGRMWFGTNGGAYIYDGVALTNLSETDGLCNNAVNDILEDDEGNFWLATHHQGVSRYDGKIFTNFTKEGTIAGIEVWSLCKDAEGNIWFPAENNGVYRFDGKTFVNYSEKDGLLTNAVQDIYQDQQGSIWMGGYLGLFRFDLLTADKRNGEVIYSVGKNGPW